MDNSIHSILTISLALLVLTLIALLVIRIRAERKQNAAVRRMDLTQFAELLRSNSLEGTIQVVAGKVSNLMKTAFGCERIIFVRKQRGSLELNFYHGIKEFSRQDFRIRYSRELAQRLREDFRPRPIGILANDVPQKLRDNLQRHGFDLFFPIFWRDNLYGVYFIKSSIHTSSESFNMLVASVAQCLSAAYHIRWHEHKLDRMRKRLEAVSSPQSLKKPGPSSNGILRLVRHRNSGTLIRKIVDTIGRELSLEKAVLVCEGRNKGEALQILNFGTVDGIGPIDREAFDHLVSWSSRKSRIDVSDLVSESESEEKCARLFSDAGLKHIVAFPLATDRAGIIVWTGGNPPTDIAERLLSYRDPVQELVNNAESFEKAEELSYTDGLTGLANQRYFHRRLKEETDRARRYTRSLALIIFDMDDLKGINDRYGHQAGDAVIKRMGQILRSSIRAIDIIARYGGDEFCVIMPEADAATCERFMERLQSKIATSKFQADVVDTDLTCTISLGGAVFPDHATGSDQLIFAADMALLRAKESGRDSSCLYESTPGVDNPSK